MSTESGMNVVLIEIGGTGEGVHVHQKIAEAMVAFSAEIADGDVPKAEQLLVSSPLREQHYADPLNEVEVNTAAGSTEFSVLGTDMQTVIDSIRRGDCRLHLRYWFTREVAEALPERVAEVEIGTGAQAVLSKGAADIEAKRIVGEIRQTIRRARRGNAHTVVFVVWGAGTGGTGTGASLEVLRLVRIVADSLGHSTVVAMPVLGARGCEILHNSQQEVDAVYARTSGIYRATCAAQASPHSVPYALADNLVVTCRQLADLTLFVEGDQGDPSAPGREPMFGLARTAAGIVDAFAGGVEALGGAIPSWRDKSGQAASYECAGSAGSSSIRIDGLHLWEQGAYLLAKAVYDRFLTRAPGEVNEGETRAAAILSGFAPATFVRALAAGERVAWQPPGGDGIRTMANLAEPMTDHAGMTGPFPGSPGHDVKWLLDEIHTSRAGTLWSVSNKAVVENSDALRESYLGDARTMHRREDSWTVRGWEAANRERVLNEFGALLDAEMLERTIDPNTGQAYTIRQRPNGLVDTHDLLTTLRNRIARFRGEVKRVLDAATPLAEQCSSALTQARGELLDAPKSGRRQRQFLQVSQMDLDMCVWQSEMEAWVDIADGWLATADRWADEVGEGATGWFTYVRELRDDVRSRGEDLLAGRLKLDCAANHTFVPTVGDAGEAALLQEFVVDSGVIDQLLGECRFVWTKDEDGAPRLLLQGLAPAPSREREAVVQRLRTLGASGLSNYKVTNHVSADLVHYARQALKRSFQKLTVMDGLAYDYTHIEIPEAERQGRTPDPEKWAQQITDTFLRGIAAELAISGGGVSGVFRESTVWGPLTVGGMHPLAARISAAVSDRLAKGTYTIVDVPANRTALRAFEIVLRVPFDAIALHGQMSAALARVPEAELGLYAPEMCVRRAELLRRVLERHGVKRLPWTFSPAATTLAADSDGTDDALRRAALGIVAGLFDIVPGKGTEPDRYGIVVAGRRLADLGDGSPLEVIRALRDPMNVKAAAALDARIEAYVAGFRGPRGGLDPSLASELRDAAYERWSEAASVGDRDEQDTHLLLLAEVLDIAEAYSRRSGGAGGPSGSESVRAVRSEDPQPDPAPAARVTVRTANARSWAV